MLLDQEIAILFVENGAKSTWSVKSDVSCNLELTRSTVLRAAVQSSAAAVVPGLASQIRDAV